MRDMLTIGDISKLLDCGVSTARRLVDQLDQEGYTVQRIRKGSPRKISRSEFQRYANIQRLKLDWSKFDE